MSRPSKSERLAAKGRPNRRAAAKTHFFKYQLAGNPSRAEENDLKRALQESLEEQATRTRVRASNGASHNNKRRSNDIHVNTGNNNSNNTTVRSSTSGSDFSRSNNSSSHSNGSAGSINTSSQIKRTRSGASLTNSSPANKRAKLNSTSHQTNGHQSKNGNRNQSDAAHKATATSATTTTTDSMPATRVDNKAIKTYSRIQPDLKATRNSNTNQQQIGDFTNRTSTPVTSKLSLTEKATPTNSTRDKEVRSKVTNGQSCASKSTQTPSIGSKPPVNKSNLNSISDKDHSAPEKLPQVAKTPPVQELQQQQYLKFKRESKNYAYAKMTALIVSNSKSPSSNSKTTTNSKKSSPISTPSIQASTSKEVNKKISPKANQNTNGIAPCLIKPNDKNPNFTPNVKNNSKSDSTSKANSRGNGKKSPTSNNNSSLSKTSSTTKDTCQNVKSSTGSSVQISASSVSRSNNSKQDLPAISCNNADTHNRSTDCSSDETTDLSKKKTSPIQASSVKVIKKRSPQGSWSLLGVPEEKVIYLRDDEPPRRMICYPAIKHVEGDVIQVRDSVLLRSGARKTDLPYIAKVCAFWEDAETGGVMMSLFWYYRPEHTEDGRKPHHLSDEIFASRHRDVDSVECIEDKCYVLTFNEYCRYRKRCKMEQVNSTWSLTDVTIPVSNESYPRRNRIPESDVNPELVFCCRQIYDSRMRRLIKNPLINSKYGHI